MPQSQQKTCKVCKKDFTVDSSDLDFYTSVDAIPPSSCPTCRMTKRLAFWPFGKFHKRACDLTGEKLISIFPPDADFPVYKTKHWYSDDWTPPEMEYDSSRSFFEQMLDLHKRSPRPHQLGEKNENCDYGDDAWESKNCYLSRSFLQCENLSYSYRNVRCRDSYDLVYCYDADQSYDCMYCFKIFGVKHSFDTWNSMNSAFLYDCRNCQNCFMCWNLRNKEYHILNIPYSKEEYEKKMEEYNTGSQENFEKIKKEFEEKVRTEAVHKSTFNIKVQNVSGNYLTECKNCHECYFLETSEDCKHIIRGLDTKDSQDAAGILRCELLYDTNQTTEGYRLRHSNFCGNCRESEYLDFCQNCEYCFGCIGLRNKKYRILNKQYSEEEYKELTETIRSDMKKRGEYGEFLPLEMAYVGYNLSFANIIYPKDEKQVKEWGGRWEDLEPPIQEGLDVADPPDDIQDVEENIVKQAILCKESKRPFNVTKDELAFLKRNQIPLPQLYPDVRTMHRMKKVFSIESRVATCHFCNKDITVYQPEELGYRKFACMDCYHKEIV